MGKKSETVCKWDRKEFLDNFEELKRIARDARYICRKCGRVARDKDWLCKPEKLD